MLYRSRWIAQHSLYRSAKDNQLLKTGHGSHAFQHCKEKGPQSDSWFNCQQLTQISKKQGSFLFQISRPTSFWIQYATAFPVSLSIAWLWKQTAVSPLLFFIMCCWLSLTLINSDWTGRRSSVQGQTPWNSMKLYIAGSRGFNLHGNSCKIGSSGLWTIFLLPQIVKGPFVTFPGWKWKPSVG